MLLFKYLQGLLVAIDRTSRKTLQIQENCLKMSAECLVFTFDSTKAAATTIESQRTIQQGPPFNINTFDKVMDIIDLYILLSFCYKNIVNTILC